MTAFGFLMIVFGAVLIQGNEKVDDIGAFLLIAGAGFVISGVFIKLWEVMP
ncbi:MAG: hypothetical protein ACRCTX_26465 [Afipia sp.]